MYNVCFSYSVTQIVDVSPIAPDKTLQKSSKRYFYYDSHVYVCNYLFFQKAFLKNTLFFWFLICRYLDFGCTETHVKIF